MTELKFYIRALFLSFFSRRFYADLIANRNIFGIWYLLILSVFVATPLAFEVKFIINHFFFTEGTSIDESVEHISKQMPAIEFHDGKIEVQSKTNQSIYSRSGNLVAVFDVESKIDDLNGYEEILVINENGMRFKFSDGGVAVLMGVEIENALKQYIVEDKFNSEKFFTDIRKILKTPLIAILVFSTIWFFIGYLVSAFALSFIVGIFISFVCKNSTFDLKMCYRIAAFTATPVALLEMLSNLVGGALFSHVSLVYFITHLIYIHFAVESYKKLKS